MRITTSSFVAIFIAGLCMSLTDRAAGQDTTPSVRRILVLPFANASAADQAWIGRAVQQDLLTDLTQGTTTKVLAPAGLSPASDSDQALRTAHEQGASIVVYGQAQATAREVRLSGQVLDAATGKSLAQLKATGPSDDLFHLEDALAGQVFTALPQDLLTAQTRQGMADTAANPQAGQSGWPNGQYAQSQVNPNSIYNSPPVQVQPAEPQVYDGGTTYNYNYYDTTPAYGYYPSYSYGYPYWDVWPYWGFGFYVSPGWGYHHHWGFGHGDFDHDHGHGHDFGGHHFNGGNNNGVSGFRGGSNFGGVARSNLGIHSVPRSTFGGFHAAASGGFHSAGAAHGGMHGAGVGGGFHGGFGGGFHGGAASGAAHGGASSGGGGGRR